MQIFGILISIVLIYLGWKLLVYLIKFLFTYILIIGFFGALFVFALQYRLERDEIWEYAILIGGLIIFGIWSSARKRKMKNRAPLTKEEFEEGLKKGGAVND